MIPRSQWSFAREVNSAANGALVPDRRSIHFPAGFQPGKIYELVYVARDPRVAGLGFAAVRDVVAYLKHAPDAVARVQRALGVGISQSGRFLRHFLYEGFNADEQGRAVFDGLIPHVAGGGRGYFNHRFAQPSRDAQPMNAILYATDLFPFTDLAQRDPVGGRRRGLLAAALRDQVVPKIFHTNTSYEYWSRAASLIHTTPDGKADAPLPDEVRVYFFPGLQHFTGPFPPARGRGGDRASVHPQSPLPVAWFWRALITACDAWVKNDTPPPPSRYPRIADRTLVSLGALAFPKIPGARPPADVHPRLPGGLRPPLRWRGDHLPPAAPGRAAVPALVPQVDADGNDLAGVRLPQLAAPLATYTGWNFRDPSIGAPWARISFLGSHFPLPPTASARASGDPRRSIAERYPDRDRYLRAFREQAEQLARDRYLLPEDLPALIEQARSDWDLAVKAGS